MAGGFDDAQHAERKPINTSGHLLSNVQYRVKR